MSLLEKARAVVDKKILPPILTDMTDNEVMQQHYDNTVTETLKECENNVVSGRYPIGAVKHSFYGEKMMTGYENDNSIYGKEAHRHICTKRPHGALRVKHITVEDDKKMLTLEFHDSYSLDAHLTWKVDLKDFVTSIKQLEDELDEDDSEEDELDQEDSDEDDFVQYDTENDSEEEESNTIKKQKKSNE